MSDLAAYMGAAYDGELKDGVYHGSGQLTFANGLRFAGVFADGAFDGEGTLHFPSGATYRCHWRRGLEVPDTGVYTFADGLAHSGRGAWGYLSEADRRFWSEISGRQGGSGAAATAGGGPLTGGASARGR
jgi:hypothetical protein